MRLSICTIVALTSLLASCTDSSRDATEMGGSTDSTQGVTGGGKVTESSTTSLGDSAKIIARNLKTFDALDYEVFSNQQWDRLQESHAKDIIVTWPDGHETRGLDTHITDLKAMFVYAPDIKISEHPIQIANRDWTAVVGVMTGTFTEPMPMPDGTSVPPTGKAFKIQMTTIGHWTADGVMDHEWLFWDNHSFMKQIGLAK